MSELGAALGRRLRRAQAEWRLPGVSAAVFRGGDVVWSDALGTADADRGAVARPDTQYRIGSITKTFTAAAVLQLRDRGALALDDPLSRHLEGLPHGGATLRHLLSHHSGLQREPPGEIWESLRPPDRDEFLATLGDAERVLEPATHWHYSNLAFALLGEVVERASGQPYREYVQEHLLAPLGLERTSFSAAPPAAAGYYVHPWTDALMPERDVDMGGSLAAGQLWSTTGDLACWGATLAAGGGDVLSREALATMHTLQVMADQEEWRIGWGVGLALYRRGDRVWAGHGGAMPGHLAGLVFRRKEQVGAAVLTNAGAGADPEGLAIELAQTLLELEPHEPEAWRPGEPPPPELEGVLGQWWSEGIEFVLRHRNGALEAELPIALPHRRLSVFRREAEDVYRVVEGREIGEVLRVVRDEAGTPVKLYWATYPFTRTPQVFGGSA